MSLLLAEDVEHEVDAERVTCHVAALHHVHMVLLGFLERFIRDVHREDRTDTGMRLCDELFLGAIGASGEFRSRDLAGARTLRSVHDDRRIALERVVLVFGNLQKGIEDLSEIVVLLGADVLLNVAPDEVVRDGVAAESGDTQELRSALGAEEVIGVDRAPDAILARAQVCFGVVHRHAERSKNVHLQIHDFVEVCQCATLGVMDQNGIYLLALLPHTVNQQHFRCFDVYPDRQAFYVHAVRSIDDAAILVGVPRAFVICELLLDAFELFLALLLFLEHFLDLLFAADVGIDPDFYTTLEEFGEFHSEGRVQGF